MFFFCMVAVMIIIIMMHIVVVIRGLRQYRFNVTMIEKRRQDPIKQDLNAMRHGSK